MKLHDKVRKLYLEYDIECTLAHDEIAEIRSIDFSLYLSKYALLKDILKTTDHIKMYFINNELETLEATAQTNLERTDIAK